MTYTVILMYFDGERRGMYMSHANADDEIRAVEAVRDEMLENGLDALWLYSGSRAPAQGG